MSKLDQLIKDVVRLRDEIETLKNKIVSTLPYLNRSFHEELDKATLDAKMEIEAFYDSKVRSLGIEALEDLISKPELIE